MKRSAGKLVSANSFLLQTEPQQESIALVSPNSKRLGLELDSLKHELADEFRKATRVCQLLAKRLSSGDYGPISGLGIELCHKRGLLISPLHFCITVFVPIKIPLERLRLRRSVRSLSRNNAAGHPTNLSKQFVRIPKQLNSITICVTEGIAKAAIARAPLEVLDSEHQQNPLSRENQSRVGQTAKCNMPVSESLAVNVGTNPDNVINRSPGQQLRGGSKISQAHNSFINSLIDTPMNSSGGTAIQNSNAEATSITGWGTLGATFRSIEEQTWGITCAHVVSSGAVIGYIPVTPTSYSPEVLGHVKASSHSAHQGIDVALIQLHENHSLGVEDLKEFDSCEYLASPPRRLSQWSWLIQRRVMLRGATTGRIVHGIITMPTVHSIEIDGVTFQDLMIVQSETPSSVIVEPGDSGTVVLMQWNDKWVWVGLVIAMLSPYQAVVCKLPKSLAACGLGPKSFPKDRLWKFE